ncbi:SnoaL-like protein [Kutzneria buriramensis]|uniref:SnoaL-like protein n=2 Tax=Kutzneria buriramensis TaxID=1045776 RepID=A0A3E0GUU8_9PSEU|nr:SnoaL-like protein [Kutzneria buriramensis]
MIDWQASKVEHPARMASWRSMEAVVAGEKEKWLSLFALDGCVEDPVGPSPFDPEGRGHHGHEAIGAFWDKAIALAEGFDFTMRDSFANGLECANVGTITIHLPGNNLMDTDGVFVYRIDEDGLIKSVRAHWEMERAMKTLRTTE